MCACERGDNDQRAGRARRPGEEGDLPPLEYGVEIIECKGINCERPCVPEELDDDGFCSNCSLQGLVDDDGYDPEAEEAELDPVADLRDLDSGYDPDADEGEPGSIADPLD